MDLARLRRANAILANADYGVLASRPDGVHARYQYFHSSDLWTATPLLDSDGQNRMEFICNCGTDRAIHSPDCTGLTLACVKFVRVKVDPSLDDNVFVLCTWLPPPSAESWANMYGSFRYYPREGRYVPITINGRNHTLPYPPHEETAKVVVRMIRDHETNKEARRAMAEQKMEMREAQKTRDYTPSPGSKFQQNRDRLKDRMTLNGHRPGTKGSVSYQTVGGIPLLGRPNPLHDSQLPSAPTYAAPPIPKPLIEIYN